MAEYDIYFKESVWKESSLVLKTLETILAQQVVKNSLIMNFIASGKDIIALSIPYKIKNLQFGLSRLDIEEMYIAEETL